MDPAAFELVGRRAAVARAVGRHRAAAELAAGRWQSPSPTTVVTHSGPLSWEQSLRAAVVACGPGAALGAWTALAVHGLDGWRKPRIHVVYPRGARPAFGTLDVVGHESRRLDPDQVQEVDGLARTSVERSAVDAAAWSSSDRSACGLLAAVVQQRVSTPARIRAELLSAGRIRRRRLVLATLADLEGAPRP